MNATAQQASQTIATRWIERLSGIEDLELRAKAAGYVFRYEIGPEALKAADEILPVKMQTAIPGLIGLDKESAAANGALAEIIRVTAISIIRHEITVEVH